ncbi:hypothetical protein PgNI_06632, partial [Pyricularia grisea]|uniref:Ketosynthase family 3 (KS3) domain-containing protein n=1 Tax=Pyricularia grisea TaxID=148305 RepID=A0A6P8B5S9_PYRGI
MAQSYEPIAIVGASGRLAGEASSLAGLWEMMCKVRSAHGRVPPSRWNADARLHPDPDRKGTVTTTHGFFLEQDITTFDAPFFSVTAKEADGMDPAKRILLEAYMAAAGTSEAMTANRVSWFFDLLGPSLTLDTACSSSLYCLHLACQSLLLGETNMALVAGVNMILHPNFMRRLTAMHMLSPDGISHTYDDRANGYGRGEGVGALVVKRLSDAIRDGDTIRAVIRGSSINFDGKTPSISMPSSDAQTDLIRRAYKAANLPINETQYVEMHGTGTPVGDPVELAAIAATFGAAASPEKPVLVGSIKPNVGHTEGCAGLAGVFKAIMSLEHGIIVPTPFVETINPRLRFAEWNLKLPEATMPWPTPGPRRISVNSFGFGGANAHVILDDAYHYLKTNGLKGNHATSVQPRLEWVSKFASTTSGNG